MATNVTQQDENKSGGAAALPAAPPAVRREQQFSPDALDETDDPALNDISTQLLGSKAITGKAMLSSGQVARNADTVEAHRSIDDKKRAEEDRASRERMNLAAWNNQKTIVGGVEMTNAEAQAARQHIIDNEDYYADRAVREGRIREGDKEKYKHCNRRIMELEDLHGRGLTTEAQERERERLKTDQVGRATGRDVGEVHGELRDQKMDATTKAEKVALKGNAANAVYGDAFQVAARPTQEFNQSATAVQSSQPTKEETAPAPSQKVLATGFGI